jgi:hypothetical protein
LFFVHIGIFPKKVLDCNLDELVLLEMFRPVADHFRLVPGFQEQICLAMLVRARGRVVEISYWEALRTCAIRLEVVCAHLMLHQIVVSFLVSFCQQGVAMAPI